MWFKVSAWSANDGEDPESLRNRLGQWILKQAVRVIDVKEWQAFKIRYGHPDDEQRLVISNNRVDYWSDSPSFDLPVMFGVFHDEDGLLDVFRFYGDAADAASAISQFYDDYQYREMVTDTESGWTFVASDFIDGVEPNLSIERIEPRADFDWDEFPEDGVKIISGDNCRTVEEILDYYGLDLDDVELDEFDADIRKQKN